MEHYPELLQILLRNRGIADAENAERFLNPDYERDLHDPFLILNMGCAVERILAALAAKEKIAIWGDYDCDGIPGSVVLHDFFKKIGYENFTVYIPHRYSEGYGLNEKGIEKLAEGGATLIITVDSGITDVDPVKRANELGVSVIITDHHLPATELPPAYAILNSKQEGDTYPFPWLSGAGTAFKLVQALLRQGFAGHALEGTGLKSPPAGWEKWLLDVVGLSTIADMVPLHGENRALAHFGLKVLRRTPRPGLRALYRRGRVNPADFTEHDVGFTIGPRINAASRMDEPIRAFELLSTSDPVEAETLADHLERKNNERRTTVSSMVAEVDRLVHEKMHCPVLVVGHESWRPGVVGLAASRIVEKYGRTAFVWGGFGSANMKGSCRSDGTLNIVSLMQNVGPDVFLDFGGHEQAGGFSVERENVDLLEARLIEAYGSTEKIQGKRNEQTVDKQMGLEEVTWDTYRIIEQLAPFGAGNPKPLFSFENVPVESTRRFGKNEEHLELMLRRPYGALLSAASFFHRGSEPALPHVSFLAHIEKDNFARPSRLRLRIVEIVDYLA